MKKRWFVLVLIGLSGQLAWMLENMYLNVFLYNELGGSPNHIAWMVALSAITATLTTILMGSLSDRLASRKKFIVGGYLFWGISVLLFGWINQETMARLFPLMSVSTLTIWLLIFWDCVMTFLGSTANDAAFNAWVTDVVDQNDRSKVESVLSILPLIAMLIIFGLLDPLTQNKQWSLFFLIIGVIVFVTGLLALWLLSESDLKKESASLNEIIQYGFKSSTIKSNLNLYWSFILLLIVGVSTQIWMPYLIIYIQKRLNIENYALILGIVLLSASVITVILGRLMDKGSKLNWLPIGLMVQVLGLILMVISKEMFLLIVSGTILMSGNMILITVSNSLIRDYTPTSQAGRFQGIRMIFGVMLPMIIGPFLGSMVISQSNQTFEELGVIRLVPTESIFIVSIFVVLLVFIPYKVLKGRGDYASE